MSMNECLMLELLANGCTLYTAYLLERSFNMLFLFLLERGRAVKAFEELFSSRHVKWVLLKCRSASGAYKIYL